MTDREDIKAALDKWQASLRKRDELQALLQGLGTLERDGKVQLSAVEQVRALLAAEQQQVELLQALLLAR